MSGAPLARRQIICKHIVIALMKYMSEAVPPAWRPIPLWAVEASAEAPATAHAVWGLWSTPEAWAQWLGDCASLRLEGPPAPGRRGVIEALGLGPFPCVVAEAVRCRRLSLRVRLPLTTVELAHWVDPQPHGWVRIVHRIRVRGMLASWVRRRAGPRLEAELPRTVARVAALARAAAAQAPVHAARLVAS